MSQSLVLFVAISACLAGAQFVQALPTSSIQSTTDENEQFDEIISSIVSVINSSNLSEVSIPSFTLSNGLLTATGGTVKNFTTLTRVGDAEVTLSTNYTRVKGSVTFTTLEIDFDELSVQLSILPTIGGSSATVAFSTNQIDLDVVIEVENSTYCPITVNAITLSKLSGVDVSFGTFSIMNLIFEYLAPLYLDTFSGILVSLAGNSATTLAQTILGNINICSV